MKRDDGSMTFADAVEACRILMDWEPPDGVVAIVGCGTVPGRAGRRRVKVCLSSILEPGKSYVIAVPAVSHEELLSAINIAADQLISDAWDDPARYGIGPGPETSSDHPIVDTTRYGKDS